jgi:hypothetical protein
VTVLAAAVWLVYLQLRDRARAQRLQDIWKIIDERAKDAADPARAADAVALMIALRTDIKTQLGGLIGSGELGHYLRKFEDLLGKAVEAKPGGPTYSASLSDPRGVAYTASVTDNRIAPAGPADSPNKQASDLAGKFNIYWSDRPARLRDLAELRDLLLRGPR